MNVYKITALYLLTVALTETRVSAEVLWSLQPVERPEVPESALGAENPVDCFVLEDLSDAVLSISPPAERRTLIRRLYLVLLGIPPSPERVSEFVADSNPDAVERLVDRVLASPRYGERWAQHWLDSVRFAESTGYESNLFLPTAYHYRDYVLRSLNEDKPYDRFVLEQIAGDSLGVDSGTGFLVAGPDDGNLSPDPLLTEQQRQDSLDEMIKSTSAVLLGLSLGCARCHDHKFDPLKQKDYYSMQAVFAGVRHGERRLRGPENDRMQAEARELRPKVLAARELVDALRMRHPLRPPIDFREYEERFTPVTTDAIQMRIVRTNNNEAAELDDIEVWGVGGGESASINVAQRDNGARAESSPTYAANSGKSAETLLDEQRQLYLYFLSARNTDTWIKIYFDRAYEIDRIVIRPRGSRVPVDYRIDVRENNGSWREIVDSRERYPHLEDKRPAETVELIGLDADEIQEVVEANQQLRNLDSEHKRLRAGPQAHLGVFDTPEQTHVLVRGEPLQTAERVSPGLPAVLGGDLGLGENAPEADRRLALAHAITSAENPLIARVIANRIWQFHFGTGIVDTPSDFGFNGSKPTHPELLDWLASHLVDSEWSLKRLHRAILTSATFRQASFADTKAMKRDAESRLLWRFPPRRLSAEALRDSILAVSGTLNLRMYGPGFDFFQPIKSIFKRRVPRETFDPDGWRRMVYGQKIRLETVGVFGSFDCPDASQMAPKRSRSTTPIQALGLFNSPFVQRQAGFFAQSIEASVGSDIGAQVTEAVRRTFGRDPTAPERALLERVVRENGLAALCRVLLNSNEFVFMN